MKNQILTTMCMATVCVAASAVCCASTGCSKTRGTVEKFGSTGAKESVESAGESTMALYGLKKAVKSMKEWMIDLETLAGNPNVDFKSSKGVIKALEAEVLDEMSTSVVSYEFTSDGKVDGWVVYSGNTPAKVMVSGMPGKFDVTFENSNAKSFRLDQKAFQEAMDKGEMFLDAYDNGLEEFSVEYGADGMPTSIKGLSMEFFGGSQYSEQYSEYKFDQQGNWISRKVKTPYDTFIQFREYAY